MLINDVSGSAPTRPRVPPGERSNARQPRKSPNSDGAVPRSFQAGRAQAIHVGQHTAVTMGVHHAVTQSATHATTIGGRVDRLA